MKSSIVCKMLLLASLSGCGYRWQPDYPEGERPSLSIPFAIGDQDGSFTQEIARAFSQSGLVDLKSSHADYRLQVSITGGGAETIGFRFAKEKISGKVSKNLVAAEGRRTIAIEAIFYEGHSEKIAYGPYMIEADADYDYLSGDSFQDLTFVDRAGSTVAVLPFSLGQLEPNEAAHEAAGKPIYKHIARKIVDALSAEW